jgi:hypothetical protein
MSTERDERKQRMLEKVRKLLAIARDTRGNGNESETAMRQANKIMAEYGIEEAEADMAAIDAGEMIFGEARSTWDGATPRDGRVDKTIPSYANVLSLGVARFCDCISHITHSAHGKVLVFKGERDDVLMARWLVGVLVQAVINEQRASGWKSRSDANLFRISAAAVLQKRLTALAKERKVMYEQAAKESFSRALMVVDRKALEIVSRFGAQKISSVRFGSSGNYGAREAGANAGNRINIPSGRPIAGGGSTPRLN